MKPQCGMSAYLINKTAIKHFFSFLPWNKYIDVYTSDINNINKLNSLCYINNRGFAANADIAKLV